MAKRVCPWWLGYFLASPVRRWLLRENPAQILAPYVREGMTVFEPGPGMGFFTLELARRVGASGKVVAVDVQAKMIAGLKRRAAKAGLLDRIEMRLATPESLGVADLMGKVDFTLACALVHEMPDSAQFFREAAAVSKAGEFLFLAEPSGHVKEEEFKIELKQAAEAGFVIAGRPNVAHSRAVLLRKT
jgi:ubiquinone/menaquinone biosynthesis C-methylase UbiE